MKATTTRRRKGIDLAVNNYSGDTISVVLTNGRKVELRKMVGKDFLFIERDLNDMGDTEKSFKLIERLSIEANKITFVEILELAAEDIEILSKGLAEANGFNADELSEEDED